MLEQIQDIILATHTFGVLLSHIVEELEGVLESPDPQGAVLPAGGKQASTERELHCPNSTLRWSSVGQVLVKCWSSVGQALVKCWSSVGQVLVKRWSSVGQVLVLLQPYCLVVWGAYSPRADGMLNFQKHY